MTGALDHQGRFTPDLTEEDEHAVTRRTVLTGAAAATAAATVPAALDKAARADSVDPNSREHIVESVGHSSDAREAVRINRVHTHGDATQAGILEWLRHIG